MILDLLSPAVAGWLNLLVRLTWGSAALHPRLYAVATLRGLPMTNEKYEK
jgi:hypothetical protein